MPKKLAKKKLPYSYEYPKADNTVDGVVCGFDGKDLLILLILRKDDPYKGHWALPGGFIEMKETAEEAIARELEEETGIASLYLEQLYTFGAAAICTGVPARLFTLSDLQRLYEAILGRELDKRNFRKKILKMGILVQNKKGSPWPQLYSFDMVKYKKLLLKGFNFEV